MRVLLKMVLDCSPDAAWRGIRSPAGLRQASAPLMRFDSLEPDGFPDLWDEGEHPVRVSTLGGIPLGEQVISIGFPPERDGARLVRDSGYGVSGIFTMVSAWEHTMAVAPLPDGRTLYRDRLVFEAGRVTALLWPTYWVFWQFRALRIRQAAKTW